jgi:hypothetical protein
LIHLGHSRKEKDPNADGWRDAETWRDMPFRDGLTYAFVLDAVLAVAALHKAYMEPEDGKKYMSACLYYQNECLCAFQEQLSNINQDNCHAIFAVSALVHVLNIGISRGGPSLAPTPPLETLAFQLTLGRGIKAVLETTWDTVSSAHYRDVFRAPGADTPSDAVNTPEVAYAMDELKRCVTSSETTSATTKDVLVSSVEILEGAFKHVEQGEDFNAVTAWPVMVNDNVSELLEKRDPLMMLICIHYGVLCLHLHNRWWAHNFGCRLIWDLSELLHALDASWLPLTSWARSRAASVRAASAQVQLW